MFEEQSKPKTEARLRPGIPKNLYNNFLVDNIDEFEFFFSLFFF